MTLVNTNELIHSKKGGEGKCESSDEREALFKKIEAFKASPS